VSFAEFASLAPELVALVAQTVNQEVVRAGLTTSLICAVSPTDNGSALVTPNATPEHEIAVAEVLLQPAGKAAKVNFAPSWADKFKTG
jgi:hypothetical protein